MAFNPDIPVKTNVAQSDILAMKENFNTLRQNERSNTAPSSPAASQFWATGDAPGGGYTADSLYMRNAANDAWILLFSFADLPAKASELSVKLAGDIVQVVSTQTGAVAIGTTTIPFDDTIPQKTEGTEIMTLAITPTNAANYLEIDVLLYAATSDNSYNLIAALFKDSTSNALAAVANDVGASTQMYPLVIKHRVSAGGTSEQTFKVRLGPTGGTVTFNGVGGNRKLGGVIPSSITIKEIKA